MLVTIISPAKKLDYSPVEKNIDSTIPSLLEHSNELIKDLKSLNPQEVSSLMSLSDKLERSIMRGSKNGKLLLPNQTQNKQYLLLKVTFIKA